MIPAAGRICCLQITLVVYLFLLSLANWRLPGFISLIKSWEDAQASKWYKNVLSILKAHNRKRWNHLVSPASCVYSFYLIQSNGLLHLSLCKVSLCIFSFPCFHTPPSVVSPRVLSVAGPSCSRWSAASHLCCLCGPVICLRAGFVGLPVWGQAWWAPMMEIVLSAAASPRFSQDSSVAGHKELCVHSQPGPKRNPGKVSELSSIF